ncbi:8736_t:CDS:2, partial [Racocetra persica]
MHYAARSGNHRFLLEHGANDFSESKRRLYFNNGHTGGKNIVPDPLGS